MNRRIVLLQALATAPAELQRLLADLPSDLAEQRPAENWAPAEIVRHLLDVESRYRARLKRVVGEDCPELQWILPPANGYSKDEELHELLRQFRAAREKTVAFLTPLSAEAWRNRAVHPSWGDRSFYYLVQQLVNHDREHINQVETVTARLATGKKSGQALAQPLRTEEEGEHESE